MKTHLLLAFAAFALTVSAEENLPPTLMTQRGKILVNEDFTKPLDIVKQKLQGFASGFEGIWRFNITPRGGKWEVADGTFTGRETAEVHHPATASRGLLFKDVVIQCDLRMNDVPLDGRKARYMMVRTTDTKDYITSVIISPTGFRAQKDDNDHDGPDKAVPFGNAAMPIKLGEWQTVVFEIKGEEMAGTLNGRSITGNHPFIGREKHSIMFVSGVEGSVRKFRVWEALPNPDWAKNKAKITGK